MSNLYAINAGNEIFLLINSQSEEEALEIFVKTQIHEEDLREEIDSFIVNASLLEKFYHDEHGHFHDDWTGEYPERIKRMPDSEREKYVETHIEKNVREFWETPKYAEMYLTELKKNRTGESNGKPSYSEDFYIETTKLIINDGGWYGDLTISKVDVPLGGVQVIYNG